MSVCPRRDFAFCLVIYNSFVFLYKSFPLYLEISEIVICLFLGGDFYSPVLRFII